MRKLLLAAWFSATLVAPAFAQKPSSPLPMQDRRDQLARDLEGLSDGDPLMRIAVMESILGRGDASAAYLAMRTGFASEDPDLRNLAMRAWLASVKRLNLTVVLPADLQKQVDAAMFDQKAPSDLFKTDGWLSAWARRSFVLALGFEGVEINKGTGKIWSMPAFSERDGVEFSISGNQIYTTLPVDFSPGQVACHLRLTPTNALTIEGTLSCEFRSPSPTLRVTAPMF